jgi:hypothetical protein
MPAKMARSAPRPPSGLPEVTVAVRIALLPCREPGKPRISKPVPGSSGESRFRGLRARHGTARRLPPPARPMKQNKVAFSRISTQRR